MPKSKLNISIDDVSPHPLSSTRVLDRCHELIEKIPDIKFSLFIPTSYWRTVRPETFTEFPLQIDKYPDFCNELKKLSPDNFEICFHGFHHGIPGSSDNDEFAAIDTEKARHLFRLMFDVVKLAGLNEKFKPIFRPPAWRMSPEAISVSKEFGIKILALSPKEYAKKTYCGADKTFDKVVYYNVNPPFEPLALFENTEIVYHACEWDKNYLSKDMTSQLEKFLVSNKKNIDFCFLEEL